MTRVAILYSILWIAMVSSCTESPKVSSAASDKDIITAKVGTTVDASAPTALEKTTEIGSEKVLQEVKNEPLKTDTPSEKKKQTSNTKVIGKEKSVSQSQPTAKTFANISFDKTVHDFGEIDEGEIITTKFKFRNTGNRPLTIDNVDVSCGCTMPSYPIIPIGPGETGEIGVVFNSKGKFGTQKPSITIKTNAVQPIVKLYMSGSIKHVFEKPTSDSTSQKD